MSLRSEAPGTTREGFAWLFERALTELYISAENNPLLFPLAAYYAIKHPRNPEGFISNKPIGLIQTSRADWHLEAIPFIREIFLHRLEIKTARDIETRERLSSELKAAGLQEVLKAAPLEDLLELLWPGITSGPDPVVRPYLVAGVDKLPKGDLTDVPLRVLANAVLVCAEPTGKLGVELHFDPRAV